MEFLENRIFALKTGSGRPGNTKDRGIIICFHFEHTYIMDFKESWKPDEICPGNFFLQKLHILIISLTTYLNLQ